MRIKTQVYPEYWRKPASYKGDHHDTWDPFQIVRLEEILCTDDGPVLRLRKMYRPDDTHMADEYARSVAYTCIFWTEEIVRMYLPEEGQRLARPGMDIIAGQAWVTAQSGGDTASLEEWTDVGEDRFFVTKVYDSDNRTVAPLPVAKVSMLLAYNDKYPAPKLQKIELDVVDSVRGSMKLVLSSLPGRWKSGHQQLYLSLETTPRNA